MSDLKLITAGLAALTILGACAPKAQPVQHVLIEPVYSKTGGGTGSCPEGYVISRTTAAPQREVCVPSDCDDPFWGTQSAVPPAHWCEPPRTFRDEGSSDRDDNGGRQPGPNDPTGLP